MRQAFTMIELIFVIVILGILSSIAIPKFGSVYEDSIISKGQSTVSTLRSAIMTRHQSLILAGSNTYPDLENNAADGLLFDNVLDYPARESGASGYWTQTTANDTYVYHVNDTPVTFTYDTATGQFDCNHTKTHCDALTE